MISKIRKLLLLATALLSVPATLAHAAPLAGKRPNIVFIITDDQGWGDLSCHGNPILKTPNLDRLHREGSRFTDFHVSPTCAPTRSALLTGRHEFRNGVTHTIYERERLTLTARTLPAELQAAGYATGIFGKWHLGDEDLYRPDQRGFQETYIHGAGGIGQSYPGSCGDAPGNLYQDPWVLHNGKFVKTTGYCTDVFFDEALRWIEKAKDKPDQPFYCHIATNAPHLPLQVRIEDEARYANLAPTPEVAKFWGMIANIDDNVGKLLKKLAALGIEKNTLVVFMNDNGGLSGTKVYNGGMRGTKGMPWLGGTRAASFWRWPGTLPAQDIAAPCAHIDFAPTLLGLAGKTISAPMAQQIEGRSLLPLLENPKADWPKRLMVTHVGRWEPKTNPETGKTGPVAVREGSWTLVNAAKKAPGEWQLFDIAADPGQTKNLAAQHPEEVTRLLASYDAWWQKTVPMMTNENAVGPAENPFHTLFYQQFPDKRPKKDAAAAP